MRERRDVGPTSAPGAPRPPTGPRSRKSRCWPSSPPRPAHRQSRDAECRRPPAVVADRPGVLLWHELRCDAGADSAVAKVLADRLAPAGQQALGAIALVSERAPARPPTQCSDGREGAVDEAPSPAPRATALPAGSGSRPAVMQLGHQQVTRFVGTAVLGVPGAAHAAGGGRHVCRACPRDHAVPGHEVCDRRHGRRRFGSGIPKISL